MLNQFSRTELLLGHDAMEKLAGCRVAVFGIGGVGGYTVEALARSGVGALDLIDAVGGDPKQAHHFLRKVEAIIDNLSNRYAQPMEIEVNLDDPSLKSEPEES